MMRVTGLTVLRPVEPLALLLFALVSATSTHHHPDAAAQIMADRTLASTTPVQGTFTAIRYDSECTAISASVRSPLTTNDDGGCMRVAASDILTNMAPVVRYYVEDENNETEVAIGAIRVEGQGGSAYPTSLNLSYSCPPDGYNGFDRAFGSYCEVTPDTQLWGTFTDVNTSRLKAIRVILSNVFPDVDALADDEPPFGTVLFDFPEGIDLEGAAQGDELAICAVPTDEPPPCPTLPAISGLNTKLQCSCFGYFGAKALGSTQIPGNWYQDDTKQLLSGITSPSGTGGLQELYFNASGFFLHAFDDPNGGPETCVWLPFCDYECEVYNYDSRFFDDLGTWNVTWKLNQEYFDVSYATRGVRAYFGNAIDAAGIFPSIIYTSVEQDAFLGLDKIGSAESNKQPDYAYYWYTRYTVGVPDQELLTPPEICFTLSAGAGNESETGTTTPSLAPVSTSGYIANTIGSSTATVLLWLILMSSLNSM